jgi:hypothetical protein
MNLIYNLGDCYSIYRRAKKKWRQNLLTNALNQSVQSYLEFHMTKGDSVNRALEFKWIQQLSIQRWNSFYIVNLSVLKFLHFWTGSLAWLHAMGGKGGSDFDPQGNRWSNAFCQSFMTEYTGILAPNFPAGDIG